MENETKVAMNRTGMQMAPVQGPEQVRYAQLCEPHPVSGDASAIALLRGTYIQESLRVGSVPLPATGKGMAEMVKGKLVGKSPEVLFDKLGERAAYERSGVRLYQAMMGKVEAATLEYREGLLADLQHICTEELEHFHLLTELIRNLGGDPTAQTPGADVSAVAALGMVQVLTDPRTTVPQCLQALLSVEMTDNASWELLIELLRISGHDELLPLCEQVLAAEQQHEAMIKQWLMRLVLEEAD